jgi:hypothetical protein
MIKNLIVLSFMKKIKILFILMVTVLAVSCSSSGSKTIFFDLSETDQQLFREEISAVLDSVCLGRFYDTHKISHYDHIYVFALKDSYANAKIDSVLVHYIYTSINGFEIEIPKYYQSKSDFDFKYSIIPMKTSDNDLKYSIIPMNNASDNNLKPGPGKEACAFYINFPKEELSFFSCPVYNQQGNDVVIKDMSNLVGYAHPDVSINEQAVWGFVSQLHRCPFYKAFNYELSSGQKVRIMFRADVK